MLNYNKSNSRFHSSSGIAIGPILFVIFVMAIIASAIASTTGAFSANANADKISNELVFQTNLIRNTIANCKMRFELGKGIGVGRKGQLCPNPSGGGYPMFLSEINPTNSDSNSSNVFVKDLMCSPLAQIIDDTGMCNVITSEELEALDLEHRGSAAVESIWRSEKSHLSIPLPIKGFKPWEYVNDIDNGGGVCFWTAPINPDSKNSGLVDGIMRAANKFRWSKTVAEGISNKSEVILSEVVISGNPDIPIEFLPPQKFIVWLVPPKEGQVDAGCAP